MLNDFVLPGAPLEVPSTRDIVPKIRARLQDARAHETLVVFVCDSHTEDDEEFSVWPKHAVKGTYGAQIVSDLRPVGEEAVVEKARYSGFFGTNLDPILKEAGVDTLLLTGCVTNICVLYTAADAAMRGYKLIVPKDSVAGLAPEDHQFALNQMRDVMGAKIT
jgi:nicotinamidase-related amidase